MTQGKYNKSEEHKQKIGEGVKETKFADTRFKELLQNSEKRCRAELESWAWVIAIA